MRITSPSGRVYTWSKPSPPTQADLDAIVAYDKAQGPSAPSIASTVAGLGAGAVASPASAASGVAKAGSAVMATGARATPFVGDAQHPYVDKKPGHDYLPSGAPRSYDPQNPNYMATLAEDASNGPQFSAQTKAKVQQQNPGPPDYVGQGLDAADRVVDAGARHTAYGIENALNALGIQYDPEILKPEYRAQQVAEGVKDLYHNPLENLIAGLMFEGAGKVAGKGLEALRGALDISPSIETAVSEGAAKSKASGIPRERVRIMADSQHVPTDAPSPETPVTLAHQMDALKAGRKQAVLVTPGATVPDVPAGFATTQTPHGTLIHAEGLDLAGKDLHTLLGHVEPKGPATTLVVSALDKAGNEIQSSAVSPQNVGAQIKNFEAMYPDAQIKTGGMDQAEQIVSQRSQPTATPTPPDAVTGARNRITEGETGPVDRQPYTTPEQAHAQGAAAVQSGEINPHRLADEVAAKPRPLTAVEVGALTEGRRQAWEGLNKAGDALDKAIATGSNQVPFLQADYDAAQAVLDKNTEALVKGGREQSAAFLARTMGTTLNEGNFAQVKGEFERSAGRAATPQESARIKALTQQLNDAQTQLDTAHKKIAEHEANKAVQDAGAKATRAAKVGDIQTRRKAIIDEINAITKEAVGKTNDAGSVLYSSAKLAKAVGKLVATYVEEGITRLPDLVDKVREHLPGATDEDIHKLISGYGVEKAPLPARSELAQQIAKLRKQAGTEAQVADLQNQLKTGQFKEAQPKPPKVIDDLTKKRDALKYQVRQEIKSARKPTPQQLAINIKRQLEISGGSVLGRIPYSSAVNAAMSPLENIVARVASKVSGVAGETEARGNFQSAAAAVKAFFQKSTYDKDNGALAALLGKGTELSRNYGEVQAKPKWYDLPSRTHEALTYPWQKSAFASSTAKMTDYLAKQGADVTNPVVMETIAKKAYTDSLISTFRNDNATTIALKRFFGGLGAQSPNARLAVESLMPVVNLPTNVAGRMAEYTGGPAAYDFLVKQLPAMITKRPLSGAERDAILRAYKRGGAGAGLIALGYFRSDDAENTPDWAAHAPPVAAFKWGAMIHKAFTAQNPNDTRDSVARTGDAAGQVIRDVLSHLPAASVAQSAGNAALGSRYKDTNLAPMGKFAADYLMGWVMPSLGRSVNTLLDSEKVKHGETYYQAKGFRDEVKKQIPGLRQTLPEKAVPNH